MPIGEEVFIVAIVFGTIAAIVWMILNFNMRLKERSRSAQAAGAVGMNELEERIRRAVEEANAPLSLQLQELQDSLLERKAIEAPDREEKLLPSPRGVVRD